MSIKEETKSSVLVSLLEQEYTKDKTDTIEQYLQDYDFKDKYKKPELDIDEQVRLYREMLERQAKIPNFYEQIPVLEDKTDTIDQYLQDYDFKNKYKKPELDIDEQEQVRLYKEMLARQAKMLDDYKQIPASEFPKYQAPTPIKQKPITLSYLVIIILAALTFFITLVLVLS